MPKPFDPCKKFACKIQDCLESECPHTQKLLPWLRHNTNRYAITRFQLKHTDNHFQEDRCHDALEQMRRCCLIHHQTSLCCSGIALDKTYPLHKLPATDAGTESRSAAPFRTAK